MRKSLSLILAAMMATTVMAAGAASVSAATGPNTGQSNRGELMVGGDYLYNGGTITYGTTIQELFGANVFITPESAVTPNVHAGPIAVAVDYLIPGQSPDYVEVTISSGVSVTSVDVYNNIEYSFTLTLWNDILREYEHYDSGRYVFNMYPEQVNPFAGAPKIDADGSVVYTVDGQSAITEDQIAAIKGNRLNFITGGINVIVNKVVNLTPMVLCASIGDGVPGDVTLKEINFVAAGQVVPDDTYVIFTGGYDMKNTHGSGGYYIYFIEGANAKDSIEGYSKVGVKATLVADNVSMSDDAKFQFSLLDNRLGTYVLTKTPLKNVVAPTEEAAAPAATTTTGTVANPETGASDAISAAVAMAVLSLAGAGMVAIKKAND